MADPNRQPLTQLDSKPLPPSPTPLPPPQVSVRVQPASILVTSTVTTSDLFTARRVHAELTQVTSSHHGLCECTNIGTLRRHPPLALSTFAPSTRFAHPLACLSIYTCLPSPIPCPSPLCISPCFFPTLSSTLSSPTFAPPPHTTLPSPLLLGSNPLHGPRRRRRRGAAASH